jgi:hypothetical protein
MKKSWFVTSLIFFNSLICVGQNIEPAPEDKAVVYFVRTSAMGAAINFSYFDSTSLIGKCNGKNYIRYECEPGSHLFWARSENKSFVEADIDPGKIYFLDAIPKLGFGKAKVTLLPMEPNSDDKKMQKIFKLLGKKDPVTFTAEELEKELEKKDDVIDRGMKKYAEEKAEGKEIAQLKKTMFYKEDNVL